MEAYRYPRQCRRRRGPKPVIDMTAADWDHIVDMNFKSVFLCSQAVLPTMLKQQYGKIVNISSIYGFTGNATRSSYAAAKAGVAVFTKSLALEHVQGRHQHQRHRARPDRNTEECAATTATKPGPQPSRKFPWAAPAHPRKSPAPRSFSRPMKISTSRDKPFT